MGKIITGLEFIEQVQNSVDFTAFDAFEQRRVAEAINSTLGISIDASNKCVAYGSTTPHNVTIDAHQFLSECYGGDTSFLLLNNQDIKYTLKNSSDYAANKLIDSTNLNSLGDNIFVTNFGEVACTFQDDILQTYPLGCSLNLRIAISYSGTSSLLLYYDDVNVNDTTELILPAEDIVFMDANVPSSANDEVTIKIDTIYYHNASEECHINDPTLEIQCENENVYDFTPISYSANTSQTSISFSGKCTIDDIKTMHTMSITGDWAEGGTEESGVYSTLDINRSFIKTSSSTKDMYVTGATTDSTLVTTAAYLHPPVRVDISTPILVYITSSDLANGNITLFVSSTNAGSGRYLLPLVFRYSNVEYELIIPITMSNGQINRNGNEVYLNLQHSKKTISVQNNRTDQSVAFRVLSSNGNPSWELNAGAGGPSEQFNTKVLNKMYIKPSSRGVTVYVASSRTDGSSMSGTIGTSVDGTTVSLIPSSFSSFGDFVSQILGSDGYYSITFDY